MAKTFMLKEVRAPIGLAERKECVFTASFESAADALRFMEKKLRVEFGIVRRTEGHVLDECVKLAQKATMLAKGDSGAARGAIAEIWKEMQNFHECGEGLFHNGVKIAELELQVSNPVCFFDVDNGFSYELYVKPLAG